MSTYNNVLGNFISHTDDLSDLDNDDYEDSGSEPEPQMGIKNNINKPSRINRIDERTQVVQSLSNERHGSFSLADSEISVATTTSTVRTRRSSANKIVDNTPKHSILGDFELANVIDCEEYLLCCKYSPYGDVFAVGLGNGTIKIFSKAGKFQHSLSDNDTKTRRYPVTCLKFYANKDDAKTDHQKMLAATYTAGYVKIWHYTTQQCVFTFDEKDRQPLALDFNSNFTRLFVAGSDCAINCYDFGTKKLLRKLQASDSREVMDGHKNRIHAIRSHPTMETVFLTGGWDQTIHYWDERTERSQKHFSGPHLCGDALDIVAEDKVIITGSWRSYSALQIWDFSTGALLKDPFQDKATSMLYCTKYSPGDFILCAGTDKNEAVIYGYSRFQVIGGITNLESAVYCADIDFNRPNIIIGSAKNLYVVNDKSRIR
ncbi:unnamed protein product [Rotaria socialis]|uniref:Uncharacterized protein n=1 Tax=Rotaria socialis TaxID=392032 RepID=A0A818D639_9BILA|nr:unnamed protein product [Rotaria socialis]CAF3442281.1 unnamed protein product [Rotaria socialis]CAF4183808.1 unnamed protein product [Rotaria socialis]CAF4309932.1 unnamed protein product [Rotaria socialis]